ncbi:MAG: NUDIX domain-containing protein [Bacilli bacterium]|nr:NUDIX domain-containing protein [Bacilli bacterium]
MGEVIEYIPYIRSMIGHAKCMAAACTCIIVDQDERVLLQKRSDNGLYGFTGGCLDLGETVIEGAIREVREECGISLRPEDLHLLTIQSGPKMEMNYPNGDVVDYVDLVFYAKVDSRKIDLHGDDESLSLAFYKREEIPEPALLLRDVKECLDIYFSHPDKPVID